MTEEVKFTRPMYCVKDKRVNVEKRRAYMREYMKKRRQVSADGDGTPPGVEKEFKA